MTTNSSRSRSVGAILVVVVALVGVAAWLLLGEGSPADVALVEPTSQDVTSSDVPLVMEGEADVLEPAPPPVVDAPVDEPAAPVETRPSDEWGIHWTLADQFGNDLREEQLLNVGATTLWSLSATLTIADAVGSDDVVVVPARDGQWTYTSRLAPVTLSMQLGHLTFEGSATRQRRMVRLRATGPLRSPDMARVTFEGNTPVGQVLAREASSGRFRLITGTPDPSVPLVGDFRPGRYVFVAMPHGMTQADPIDAFGEFEVVDMSPQTVSVEFARDTTVTGVLTPPPTNGEDTRVVANTREPWLGLRYYGARVSHDGKFKIEHIPPGNYVWTVERGTDDVTRISEAAGQGAVIEGLNRVTLIDVGHPEPSSLTLRTRGSGYVRLLAQDAPFRTVVAIRPESSDDYVLPMGTYTYVAVGDVPDSPKLLEGTFTLGREPVELAIDLSVDN